MVLETQAKIIGPGNGPDKKTLKCRFGGPPYLLFGNEDPGSKWGEGSPLCVCSAIVKTGIAYLWEGGCMGSCNIWRSTGEV